MPGPSKCPLCGGTSTRSSWYGTYHCRQEHGPCGVFLWHAQAMEARVIWSKTQFDAAGRVDYDERRTDDLRHFTRVLRAYPDGRWKWLKGSVVAGPSRKEKDVAMWVLTVTKAKGGFVIEKDGSRKDSMQVVSSLDKLVEVLSTAIDEGGYGSQIRLELEEPEPRAGDVKRAS